MTTVYKCKFCNQAFTNEEVVFLHIKVAHPNELLIPIFIDEEPGSLKSARKEALREN